MNVFIIRLIISNNKHDIISNLNALPVDIKLPDKNICIDVIIPIFNVKNYLNECLDSLIKQSFQDFNIILIDDGSTDESLQICIEYANKDNRILIIEKPNGGLSSARNAGLEFIRGTKLSKITNFLKSEETNEDEFIKKNEISKFMFERAKQIIEIVSNNHIKIKTRNINDVFFQDLPNDCFVHFIDSDDYIAIECLEECNNSINDDIDIVWHGALKIYEDKEIDHSPQHHVKLYNTGSNIVDSFESGVKCIEYIKPWVLWWAWQGVFRASVLNNSNLRFCYGVEYEDNEFGTIIFCEARKIKIIDKNLLFYRIRKNSITQGNSKPNELPHYLQELEEYFEDYKTLKNYFKAYSLFVVAFNMAEYIHKNNKHGHKIKEIIYTSINILVNIACETLVHEHLKKDPKNIKKLWEKIIKIVPIYSHSYVEYWIRLYKSKNRKIAVLFLMANLMIYKYINKLKQLKYFRKVYFFLKENFKEKK